MPNKTQELQDYAESLTDKSVHYEFTIVYRRGWWAMPEESRWFGDRGEYLGATVEEAKRTISLILG